MQYLQPSENDKQSKINKFDDQTRQDYKATKFQRLMKLQQILSKNQKLRQLSNEQSKQKNTSNFILNKPLVKKSLPSIKSSIMNQNNTNERKLQKNSLLNAVNKNQSLNTNKYQDLSAFSNQIIIKALRNKSCLRQHKQNPQRGQNIVTKNYLKLKVKNLKLQEKQHESNDLIVKKLKSSSSIESIQRLKTIERTDIKEFQKEQKQREQKLIFRRRKRNVSFMNLTKIQHLPQIIFPKNKRCQRIRFPNSSMAQIDNNLLTDEIHDMQQKMMIQLKARQNKQRLFQQKIRIQQQNQFFNSIYQ